MEAVLKCRKAMIAATLVAAFLAMREVVALAQADELALIDMRTEIFGLGGLHVATSRTRVDTGAGRYQITTDVESRGIARLFVAVMTHSEVHGRVALDQLHPEAYRGEVHRNGADSYSRVDYAVDGSATGAASPPSRSASAVPPGPMRGTFDQLTAFYMMERRLARGNSCALTVAVFDGRRLYKLHFTDAGSVILQATDGQGFAGPSQVCRVEREPIAGFSDDDGRTEGVYEGKLWCARLLADDILIPVRMDFATEFGPVSAHLADLRAHGSELHFAD
jgi:hypothetical protein